MDVYYAAAIQVDQNNPLTRNEMKKNTANMLRLIDQAIIGYKPFHDIRLVVFPEFAHAAPAYGSLSQIHEKLAVEIPNEHTDKLVEKAKEHNIYIQSGSFLEKDPKWPGSVFNTTCLIGPSGILSKYRKLNTWIPWEVHTSPHDLEGYDEELLPVVDTEIGRLGVATCYDWLFPEVTRELAVKGAEVLIRISAYMDPWGSTAPTDWWTVVNRCRALENLCYVVACNQGASDGKYPPFSWPGGSMIVDLDGRILSEASPGPGEKVVIGPIHLNSLRAERERRIGHHMLSHRRSEIYSHSAKSAYAPNTKVEQLEVAALEESIRLAKSELAKRQKMSLRKIDGAEKT